MNIIVKSFDFHQGIQPVIVGSIKNLLGLGRCFYARKSSGGWVRKHEGFGINTDVMARINRGEFGEIKMIVFDYVGSSKKPCVRYTVTPKDFQRYAVKDNLGNGYQWFLNETYWQKEARVKQPVQREPQNIQPEKRAELMRGVRRKLFG